MSPVGLTPPSALSPVRGVELASVASGIKVNGKDDLVVFKLAAGSTVAATFTRNAFCAAPVHLARAHLSVMPPRALVINSGNANAGTGERGMQDARETCQKAADVLGCDAQSILVFSTGVIGEYLPLDKLLTGVEAAGQRLQADNWLAAAHGIMTTDTIAKACSEQIKINGETVTLTGIAKGSGMIHPDMATMLAFIATDVKIEQAVLQNLLSTAVHNSFNSITVDGDTSTNDACVLIATGHSTINIDSAHSEAAMIFRQALHKLCIQLAQAIVRDGEGASKFVTIEVVSANDEDEARQVGFTIAHSPLVKTALFASDPNWGRILAAVGRAGLTELDVDKVNIFLGETCIVEQGGVCQSYTEEQGQQEMNKDEILIRVVLNRGDAQATLWTTDLSHEYVTINSEYRS